MDLYSVRNKLLMGSSLSDINLRVVIYARVSTDHLDQQKSLKNQVEHFMEYILGNSNWVYVDSYIDDGITGTSDVKRNNFMKMIEDSKNNKFDLIVTKEISRFSRNTLDSIKYSRLLLSYGVAVFFVSDNINTILSDSELRLTIMASMAQDEVRRLSERVKFGMKKAIERGEILGNDMLYGYKKNKDNGCLEIIESEKEVIQTIFELYVVKSFSLSKIAKYLNDNFIQEKKWYSTTISRIIENPKYKGYYCGRKTEVLDYMTKKIKYIEKDNWVVYKDNKKVAPIVSEELWDLANEKLNSRKKKDKKNINSSSNKYIYSAKIVCKKHNTIFHRKKFRKCKKDGTWVCSMYLKHGKKYCDTPNIREVEIKEIFLDIFKVIGISVEEIFSFLIDIYSSYKSSFNIDCKLYDLIKEKEKCYLKKNKLLDLNVNNLLTKSELLERIAILENECKNIDKKISNLFRIDNDSSLDDIEKFCFRDSFLDLVFEKMISFILKKIVVSSNEDKDNIFLDIYLNYCFNNLVEKRYVFKRGFDTVSTKRYDVFYNVKFISCC